MIETRNAPFVTQQYQGTDCVVGVLHGFWRLTFGLTPVRVVLIYSEIDPWGTHFAWHQPTDLGRVCVLFNAGCHEDMWHNHTLAVCCHTLASST